MTFKELKVGYTTYHFHKGEEIKAGTGKVVSVSNLRFQNPTAVLQNPFAAGTTSVQVVDVTIEEDGVQKTYTIPENLDLTYAGSDHAIATSKERMLDEVSAVKTRADEVIASVKKNEAVSDACMQILEDWNPTIKEKRENELRMMQMEARLARMAEMMEKMAGKMTARE